MPTESLSLVDTNLKKLKPPTSGRQVYLDTALSGFALEVLAGGTMTFYRLGRIFGKPTRLKLGNFPQIRCDLARELCVHANSDIAKGVDPRKKKAKIQAVTTLGELWAWYYSNRVEGQMSEAHKIQSVWSRRLSQWSGMKLDEIDRSMCVELQTHIRKTREMIKQKPGRPNSGYRTGGPAAANHTMDLLRALYKTAVANKWCDESPMASVSNDVIRSRDRFLQASEMRVFFQQLEQCTPVMRDIFRLALFTGMRRNNVCAARKEHVDFDLRVWTIPWDESKNRDPIRVRLIPQAMEIFLRRLEGDSVWFFPSRGRSGHVVDPSRQWENLLERSGLSNLRIHDLRRTIASWQAGAGTSLHIIQQSLSQKNSKSTQIYARLQDSAVRDAVENAANLILEAASEEKIKEVESRTDDV